MVRKFGNVKHTGLKYKDNSWESEGIRLDYILLTFNGDYISTRPLHFYILFYILFQFVFIENKTNVLVERVRRLFHVISF